MAGTEGLMRWQSHKIVHAASIVSVEGDMITIDLDPSYPPAPGAEKPRAQVKAAPNMFARYHPVPGDYYVVYDDGYASISPRKAFEEGYHKL